ncbi:hypothetical protein [Rhodoferax lithotrophicus]|uniref:hypothetical protein n=1 Tax=Rhodoferax lithotrophicus TaxID=2798804 RepID=UPI001CC34438|nr:hypothetical protein [Rhodoferax sp. MIZ03]
MTLLGSGGDDCVVSHFDMRCRCFNHAAIAPQWGRGIKKAAHIYRGTLHVTHQANAAVVLLDGLRLNHPGVVDGVVRCTTVGQRGEQHLPPIGLNQPTVGGTGLRDTLTGFDIPITVRGARHGHRATSGQCHAAELGYDHPLVGHTGPQQGHVTAACGIDVGEIDHRGPAIASELVGASSQVTACQVQGRGHQAAHIHRCTLTKHNAIGVDQEQVAVG